MIRPIIEYGAVLTDNCSISDALKLDKVQRTAALICTGAMRRTETGLLLDFLGWEKLGDRRKLSKTAIFYKIINKTIPEYLSKNPIVNSTYSLRSSYSNLIKPYLSADVLNTKILSSPIALNCGTPYLMPSKFQTISPFLKLD